MIIFDQFWFFQADFVISKNRPEPKSKPSCQFKPIVQNGETLSFVIFDSKMSW